MNFAEQDVYDRFHAEVAASERQRDIDMQRPATSISDAAVRDISAQLRHHDRCLRAAWAAVTQLEHLPAAEKSSPAAPRERNDPRTTQSAPNTLRSRTAAPVRMSAL
jgi:hypothetical protein